MVMGLGTGRKDSGDEQRVDKGVSSGDVTTLATRGAEGVEQ